VIANPSPPPLSRFELLKAAVLIIGLLLGLLLLWQIRALILLTLLGGLLGIAAKPAVDWLQERRFRRAVGSPLVILGSLVFIAAVVAWSGPTLGEQFRALREQVPQAVDKLDAYFAREHGALLDAVLPADTTAAGETAEGGETSGRIGRALVGQVSSLRGLVFGAVTSTVAVIAGIVYVLFLTIYLAIDPFGYRRGILFLVPEASRRRAAVVFDAMTATLRKWLSTQFIAMVVIGTVTTIVLLVFQVKSAIPLGILAGLLEFVPNFGPIIAAIPAVLIAFADSPEKALWVGLAYCIIQFLENNVLIPHLMKEELDLPPALTLLWQALMAIIFGVLGLFVAVPLLAATVVAVRYLYVRGDVPPVRKPRGSRELLAVDLEEPGDASPA
jgi:predicted PurR-regulated permease PerM